MGLVGSLCGLKLGPPSVESSLANFGNSCVECEEKKPAAAEEPETFAGALLPAVALVTLVVLAPPPMRVLQVGRLDDVEDAFEPPPALLPLVGVVRDPAGRRDTPSDWLVLKERSFKTCSYASNEAFSIRYFGNLLSLIDVGNLGILLLLGIAPSRNTGRN